MKRLLLTILLCIVASPCYAEDFYIANASAGGDTGADCANAHAYTFFNAAGNWGAGAGKISAGDTVHFCGTISNQLIAQGVGSAGSVITLLWETGAKLSRAAGTPLIIDGQSFLLLNGGTNGIIENTANGTNLANQVSANGVSMDTTHDIEIKNLTIKNLFVHVADPVTENAPDQSAIAAVHCSTGCGVNINIHDNTFDNNGWNITLLNPTGSGNLNWSIKGNHISNYCHGISFGGNAAGVSGVTIDGNHMTDGANWQSENAVDTCHQDGIHLFHDEGDTISGIVHKNNTYDGDWAGGGTAYVYLEGYQLGSHGIDDFLSYNNTYIIKTGNAISNGAIWSSATNAKFYNETIIGGGASVNGGCVYLHDTTGFQFKNNIISSCKTLIDVPSGTYTNVDYNLYVDGGTTALKEGSNTYSLANIANWKTAIGGDGNSLTSADAKLTSTGAIQSDSPAKDAGTSLAVTFQTDRNGTARPQGLSWDIGAYEYIAYPSMPLGSGATMSIGSGATMTVH